MTSYSDFLHRGARTTKRLPVCFHILSRVPRLSLFPEQPNPPKNSLGPTFASLRKLPTYAPEACLSGVAGAMSAGGHRLRISVYTVWKRVFDVVMAGFEARPPRCLCDQFSTSTREAQEIRDIPNFILQNLLEQVLLLKIF